MSDTRLRHALYFVIPAIVAGIAAVTIIAVRAQGGGTYVNPDAGLTDAQRDAKYGTARAGSTDQQAKINEQFATAHTSVANLPRIPSLAFYDRSQYNIAQATAAAHDVVYGTITDQYIVTLRGQPAVSSVVSVISVQGRLKGAGAGTTVELEQAGTPVLRDDGTYALVVNENDSVMNVGDEVLVFSRSRSAGGRLLALPYKVMQVKNGHIIPNKLDDKVAGIAGLNTQQVFDSIRVAARQ